MAISDKLQSVLTAKAAIKAAIVSKGQDMTGVTFSGYADKILAIETDDNGSTYSDITLSGSITYNDATAAGGSAIPVIPSYSQTKTKSNGETEIITEGATMYYTSITEGLIVNSTTGAVSASNLGTTVTERTLLGYVVVHLVLNSKMLSREVAVYQAANTYEDDYRYPIITSFTYPESTIDGNGGMSGTPTVVVTVPGSRRYTSNESVEISKTDVDMGFSCNALSGFGVHTDTGVVTADINDSGSERTVIVTVAVGDNTTAGISFETFTITQPPASNSPVVDLGLSVKWATCNIGANSPEEYGEYFAWGETTGYTSADKHTFNLSNYKFYDSANNKFLKYNHKEAQGVVDNKVILDSEDDAAIVNKGSSWRIPTKEECAELLASTTQKAYTFKGISGTLCTSNINGNTIFFPNAGLGYNDGTILRVGKASFYWTNIYARDVDSVGFAYALGPTDKNICSADRSYGFTIRPVYIGE